MRIQDLLDDLQDLGVRRGGGSDGDGLALQGVVVHAGVIAVGGILHHGDDGAVVGLADVVGHLLALQRGLQSQDLGLVLIALLDGQNVGVGGGAALDEQGVGDGVQTGIDGIVAVDDSVVQIGQHIGQLSGLSLHDLHVVGIVHDVVLGGGDAGVSLQLEETVLLQQGQGAGLVGGVVGDGNADLVQLLHHFRGSGRGSGRSSAACSGGRRATASGQSQSSGGNTGCCEEAATSDLFHK